MSKFIELSDYDASMHRDILEATTRKDDAIVEICEDRAIEEMRCYLSKRYDCDRIFSAKGKERNALILMFAKDITLYHVCSIHNPQKFSPIRKERYDRAMEWLKAVSKVEISIADAPLLDGETARNNLPTQIRSNPKRVTHY